MLVEHDWWLASFCWIDRLHEEGVATDTQHAIVYALLLLATWSPCGHVIDDEWFEEYGRDDYEEPCIVLWWKEGRWCLQVDVFEDGAVEWFTLDYDTRVVRYSKDARDVCELPAVIDALAGGVANRGGVPPLTPTKLNLKQSRRP